MPGSNSNTNQSVSPLEIVTSTKSKKRVKSIVAAVVIIIFLFVSVVAGVLLVGQNQNIQEKAKRPIYCPDAEACPYPPDHDHPAGYMLSNCTPNGDSDGTPIDSLCNGAGRIEPCGGSQFCCPAANGVWTTDMTACTSPPAVNGVCAATHYNCTAGTSANNVNGTTAWTWECNGSNGGTNASCTENKPVTYSCSGIGAYDTNVADRKPVDLSKAKPGDIIYFSVKEGSAATGFVGAKFKIKGVETAEITSINFNGEFYYEYTVPAQCTVSTGVPVQAKIHYQSGGADVWSTY